MTETLIPILTLVLGYFMGWFPHRHDKFKIVTDYADSMKNLCEQFANLSCELFNQKHNSSIQSNTDPLLFEEPSDEDLAREAADMMGAVNG